jgi:hypothetical protein
MGGVAEAALDALSSSNKNINPQVVNIIQKATAELMQQAPSPLSERRTFLVLISLYNGKLQNSSTFHKTKKKAVSVQVVPAGPAALIIEIPITCSVLKVFRLKCTNSLD